MEILWMEDDSLGDLAELLGPVYVDGTYHLTVARNATEGFQYLMKNKFEAVIVDIRLPPGEDKKWINLYNESKKKKETVKLGLLLLREVLELAKDENNVNLHWIQPKIFGVLTVEPPDILKELPHGIEPERYCHKSKSPSPTMLLDLINKVVAHAKSA